MKFLAALSILLAGIFVTLKLLEVIAWTWLWILSPIWIFVLIYGLVYALLFKLLIWLIS